MCECSLIIDKQNNPIELADDLHKLVYFKYGKEFVLLEDIKMNGTINYSAAHEIKDMYGVKTGYMFIIGEKDNE